MTERRTHKSSRHVLFVVMIAFLSLTGYVRLHAQVQSKWDRVDAMAQSLMEGEGETAAEVARRLFLKNDILDILYAEEGGYPVYYVDQDATGLQDGTSWENAFVTIQPAIDAAEEEGWVWVAEGEYTGQYYDIEANSYRRIGAIKIKPGVALFGGFAGDETSLSQRDPEEHATIIRGRKGSNGYRAVYMDHRTLIDGFIIDDSGFTVTANKTSDHVAGGGIKTGDWLAVIRNNRLFDNQAKGGGAIAVWNRHNASNVVGYSPILEHNVIYENEGVCGAGVQIRNSEALFCHNVVAYNTSDTITKRKGIEIVIEPQVSDAPVIVNTIAWGNAIGSTFPDIYNHVDYVAMYGNSARAESWFNCMEKYRSQDRHQNPLYDDPLFTDAGNADFTLLENSPCIDAGLLGGPLDPDGTRADIGMFTLKHPLNIVDESGIGTTGAGVYFHGTLVTIVADSVVTDSAGTTEYRFQQWIGEGDSSYTGPSRSAVVRMNGPVTQTVVWDKEFMLNVITGTVADTLTGWYSDGSEITLAVPTLIYDSEQTRRRFVAWEGEGPGAYSGTDTAIVLSMAGPIRQTAVWETEHRLTVISEFGQPEGNGWVVQGENADFSVTTPVDVQEGVRRAFVQWIGEGADAYGGNQPIWQVTMNGPVTQTAVWKTQYTLTLVSPYGSPTGGGWYDEGESATIDIDTVVAVDETHRRRFTGWQGTGASAYTGPLPGVEILMTGPVTETAEWTLQVWLAVDCNPPNGGTVAPAAPPGGWITQGALVSLTAVEDAEAGYGFDGWTGDIQSTDNPLDLVIDASMQVTAGFRQGSFILKTEPPGLTLLVDDQPVTAPHVFFWDPGETHTIDVSTPQVLGDTLRCRFDRWDDGGEKRHGIQAADVQQVVTAFFGIDYAVNIQSEFAGESIVGAGWHAAGSLVQVGIDSIAPGDTGVRHCFDAWTGTFASESSITTFEIHKPVWLQATWHDQVLLSTDIQPQNAGHVVLQPAGPWFDTGTSVRLEAVASDPDMVFYRWEGALDSSENPLDMTLTQPISLTARFNYLYNQPPVITDIPDCQTFEDGQILIDLPDYIDDPTDALDRLTVDVDCSDAFILDLDTLNTTLTLTPQPDWFGSESMTLTVSDPWQLSDADTFHVVILPVNDPPEPFLLLDPPDETAIPSRPPPTLFSWQASDDVDGDALVYDFYLGADSTFTGGAIQVMTDLSDTTLLKIWTADIQNNQYWRVIARDGRGGEHASPTFVLVYTTSVETGATIPETFAVSQNYPNPFNPATRIDYSLPNKGHVSIRIFNARGGLVDVLVDEERAAGNYAFDWRAFDTGGHRLPSGHYYLQAVYGTTSIRRKLTLIK